MMRGCFLLLAGLLVSSCDRSDYVIHVQRFHIEQVSENGGSGYIVVDKAAADNMAKYGDVYIDGKFCPEAACEAVPVGSVDKYNQEPVNGGIKLKVEFREVRVTYRYPPFWLKNVACLKVDAVQGFMGRAGKSDWNCAVAFSDAGIPGTQQEFQGHDTNSGNSGDTILGGVYIQEQHLSAATRLRNPA